MTNKTSTTKKNSEDENKKVKKTEDVEDTKKTSKSDDAEKTADEKTAESEAESREDQAENDRADDAQVAGVDNTYPGSEAGAEDDILPESELKADEVVEDNETVTMQSGYTIDINVGGVDIHTRTENIAMYIAGIKASQDLKIAGQTKITVKKFNKTVVKSLNVNQARKLFSNKVNAIIFEKNVKLALEA